MLPQIGAAISLDYSQKKLLAMCRTDGHLSIPRLIYAAVTENRPISDISHDVDSLADLGVQGPQPDDLYLGLRWLDIVSFDDSSEARENITPSG